VTNSLSDAIHGAVLPDFPLFERLSVHHKDVIDAYFRLYSPYSDFTFVTMWCWDRYDSAEICTLNDNLVLGCRNYASGEHSLSFLGAVDSCETALSLLEYTGDKFGKPQLDLVPEVSIVDSVKVLAGCSEIKEERNSFDYILDLQALASFCGPAFASKRKAAACFDRAYCPTVRDIDLSSESDKASILSVFSDWADSQDRTPADTEKELSALRRALAISQTGALVATGVLSGERMVGFAISEVLSNQFAVGHFLKADTRLRGVFEYLRRAQACRLQELGCRWINVQEDLGLPGLRQAKLSYRPVALLRKYTLRRADYCGSTRRLNT
jgi:hypothetical protein